MSSPVTNFTMDSSGAPRIDAVASFAYYGTIAGVERDAPAIINLANGEYVYLPTNADRDAGTIGVINFGVGSYPRYATDALHLENNSNQFWAFHLVDLLGALWTGAAPVVGSYKSAVPVVNRAPPAVVAVQPSWLYALTPTRADVAARTSLRIDAGTLASPSFLKASTSAIVTPYLNINASPGLAPLQLAATALRDYLLQYLPPKVTQLNESRWAELTTPGFGAFQVTAGMSLKLGAFREGTWVTVPLTAGSQSPQDVANDISNTGVPGIDASVDGHGRLLLRCTTATNATTNVNSCVGVGPDSTGANTLLGWGSGGEHVLRTPIRAPNSRGICDGAPPSAPDNGQGFWVILDERTCSPWPDAGKSRRNDEYLCTFSVVVFRPESNLSPFRSREGITSCTRAIREVLSSHEGLQLGRASAGDIVVTEMGAEKVSGRPFSFNEGSSPNFLLDMATFTIAVKVFQRPPIAVIN